MKRLYFIIVTSIFLYSNSQSAFSYQYETSVSYYERKIREMNQEIYSICLDINTLDKEELAENNSFYQQEIDKLELKLNEARWHWKSVYDNITSYYFLLL